MTEPNDLSSDTTDKEGGESRRNEADRRAKDRREAQQPFEGADRRKNDRRSGKDRRDE